MNLTSNLVNFADALSSQVNSPILLLHGTSKSVSAVNSGKRSEFRNFDPFVEKYFPSDATHVFDRSLVFSENALFVEIT